MVARFLSKNPLDFKVISIIVWALPVRCVNLSIFTKKPLSCTLECARTAF